MQKLFNRILVPTDFTNSSKRIVEKAIELAAQYDCSIHLLHIANDGYTQEGENKNSRLNAPVLLQDKHAAESQLELLIQSAAANTGIAPDNIRYTVETGNWDDNIIEFASRYKIDLVLIGQQTLVSGKQKTDLNADMIASKTDAPVITIPSNRCINQYSSIMIPITDFLPVKKLMYGVYIALKNNISIRLLGVENAGTKDKMIHYLGKAYKLISDNCNVKVELEKTESADVNEAVKKYAFKKHTDLIILEPGNQPTTPGLLSTFLGNLLHKYASPPVLTVSHG